MIVNLSWTEFKSCKDSSGNTIFYSVENEYISNDPNVADKERYFLEMTYNSDQLQCFICITDPKNIDQQDFEDNYKSSSIESQL